MWTILWICLSSKMCQTNLSHLSNLWIQAPKPEFSVSAIFHPSSSPEVLIIRDAPFYPSLSNSVSEVKTTIVLTQCENNDLDAYSERKLSEMKYEEDCMETWISLQFFSVFWTTVRQQLKWLLHPQSETMLLKVWFGLILNLVYIEGLFGVDRISCLNSPVSPGGYKSDELFPLIQRSISIHHFVAQWYPGYRK